MLTIENHIQLKEQIRQLADSTNTLILAHNYQLPEIQDIADYVGDSLQLARKGLESEEQKIIFCGVHFMAETCSILSPEKEIYLPDMGAGCSLDDSITLEELKNWKSQNPGAIVVQYVNTTAAVKTETDYACTSSNAVAVIKHILEKHGPDTQILFGPDMFLGSFVEKEMKKIYPDFTMKVWMGECHVHAGITPTDIKASREAHPEAEFLIHPECGCSTSAMEYVAAGDISSEGVHMLSTGQMLDHVKENDGKEFIVATENGMIYPLQQQAPNSKLIPANRQAFCKYMKMITLDKVYRALKDNPQDLRVKVPTETAEKAYTCIQRMVEIG